MINGFLLINKKENMTSRSVDNIIQRLFHIKKVGHLGTLDPFATGLLIIALEKGCKSLPYIDDSFKTYEATLVLGKKTDSGDLTGQIIEEKDIPTLSQEDILNVLNSFVGESEQIPPMKSAIHYDGKRLYEMAREGTIVDVKPRNITIKSLELLSFDNNIISFEVCCSKGTYVRTLGEDIAYKLGTVGYLTKLNRTAIGDINLCQSVDINDIDETKIINPVSLISLKHIVITNKEIIDNIKNGKNIKLDEKEDNILLCYYIDNILSPLAVYSKKEGDIYVPERGLW